MSNEISETQKKGEKYITVAYYFVLSREYPDSEETKILERQIASDPEYLEIMKELTKKKRTGDRGAYSDTPDKIREFHKLRKQGIQQNKAQERIKREFGKTLDIRTYKDRCYEITKEGYIPAN